MTWLRVNLGTLLTLNLQELTCVMTPFVVKIFSPVYYVLMIACPHWKTFGTSLVHTSKASSWTWVAGILVVLEIIATSQSESNILFVFFLELALQSTQHRQCGQQIKDMQ